MWIYLVIIVIVLIVWKYFIFRRPPKYPPGPIFRVPIFKQVFYFLNGKVEGHEKLRKRYGDVYSIDSGKNGAVVISELSVMKKLLSFDVFSVREHSALHPKIKQVMMEIRGGDGDHGIATASGDDWKEQRRFTLKHLKDFGLGKKSMESLILDEVKELSEKFKSDMKLNDDNEIPINWSTFNMSILNALWGIVSGKRFDVKNSEAIEKFQIMNELLDLIGRISFSTILAFALPYPFRTWIGNYQKMKNYHHTLYDWFDNEYKQHLKSYDEQNLRDYIDCYISERKKAEEEKDIESSFYGVKGHWNFVCTMLDLFVAGAETTSSTLQWAIAYLVHNLDVQKIAQKELDEVVGRSRLPSLDDLEKMPYIEALLSEIQRCANVGPFSLRHAVSENVEVGDFFFPKGTHIIPNLSAILNDPKNFEHPEVFNPDRFLCKETGTFLPHPALVVFGVGKRECLGKTLAKKELYLFVAGLLHQFSFQPSTNGWPDLRNATVSLTRTPKPFHVKVVART